METISVSNLKAHLSAELKKVKAGNPIVVLDHRHPVAMVVPYEEEPLFLREASRDYRFTSLPPLTGRDPMDELEEERAERW